MCILQKEINKLIVKIIIYYISLITGCKSDTSKTAKTKESDFTSVDASSTTEKSGKSMFQNKVDYISFETINDEGSGKNTVAHTQFDFY